MTSAGARSVAVSPPRTGLLFLVAVSLVLLGSLLVVATGGTGWGQAPGVVVAAISLLGGTIHLHRVVRAGRAVIACYATCGAIGLLLALG